MQDKTIQFSLGDEREREIRKTLILVYNALKEKGYNPINYKYSRKEKRIN